jgi:hypothetical protein
MSIYHAATFAFLGRTPVVSAASEQMLRLVERDLGVRLPASVREWYGYAGAVEILGAQGSNPPVELAKLGELVEWWLPYRAIDEQLLPIVYENQGVCTWAVDLADGDDPQVMVEVDSGSPPHWQRCAAHFSEWVYLWVWDWLVNNRIVYASNTHPLSTHELDLLHRELHLVGRTYAWPGVINYRFHAPWGDIIIWDWRGQADWFIAPAAEQDEHCLDHVWAWGDLAETLYGLGETARQRLKQRRSGRGKGLDVA